MHIILYLYGTCNYYIDQYNSDGIMCDLEI